MLPNVLGNYFGLSLETQESIFILTFVALILLSGLFLVSVSYLIVAQVQGIKETRMKRRIKPINSPSMTKKLVDEVAAFVSINSEQNSENWDHLYNSSEANA